MTLSDYEEIYIDYKTKLLNYYVDLLTRNCINELVSYLTMAKAFYKGFSADDYIYILAHMEDYQQLFKYGQFRIKYTDVNNNRQYKFKIYFTKAGKISKFKFLGVKNV